MNHSNRASEPPTSFVSKDIGCIALLLAVIFAISWPGMQSPLVFDDVEQMEHVESFDSWHECIGVDCYDLFRPFKNFAYHALRDSTAIVRHGFTLSLFMLAACAVYLLLRRLLGTSGWALTGAMLWATSPTHVSSAIWLSAFNISLSLALACACITCHDLSRQRPGRQLGWSALACLLLFISQLSYETALAVPGLCVLVDLLRRRTILSRDAILRYAALGLVTLAYLIVRNALGATLSFEERNSSFSPDLEAWHMTLSAPWFLWKHFTMWLMPFGRLEFLGTYVWAKSASPMHLAAAWVWLLVMIAACGLAWKRRPLIAIGVLWFLVASFPTSNLIPVWNGPIVDYYLMLPSIGLVMALVGILRWLLDFLKQAMGPAKAARRRAVACALGMVIIWRLAMVPLFWFQAGLWDDPLKLYLHAEATRPYQYQLQTAIAQELLVSGQLEQAKLYANLAREGGPWSPASYLVLGTIALEQGEPEKAQNHFTQVLKRSYSGSFIHDYSRLNLGKAVMLGGGRPEQVHEILLPLLREPNADQHIEAIQVLVDANLKHARTDAAARVLRRALELHPEKQEFRLQLEALQSGDDP